MEKKGIIYPSDQSPCCTATGFWEAERESQKEGKIDEKTYKAAKKPQDRQQEQSTTGSHIHNGKRKRPPPPLFLAKNWALLPFI